MRIKKGISDPLEYTLKGEDGIAIDLTDATLVKMRLMKDGESYYTIDSSCNIDDDATSGKVSFNWTASQTRRTGFYWLNFVITWEDGTKQEVPSNGFDYIVIL